MRFGLNLANFGWLGDVAKLVELALDAEAAGWDGFFLWDHVNWPGMGAHADPWIALGVIASRTEHLVLGTAVTPLSRRRPVKLAREVLTLDALSGGRFVLGVGSGGGDPAEYGNVGEASELRERAALLDEGLEAVRALCGEGAVDFEGRHHRVKTAAFGPPASGRPVPIWVAATWPKPRPVSRAARFDGVMPILDPFTEQMTPQHVRELVAFVAERRDSDAPFDVAVSYAPWSDDPKDDVATAAAYRDAGATWYLEAGFPLPGGGGLERLRDHVRRGPPRD